MKRIVRSLLSLIIVIAIGSLVLFALRSLKQIKPSYPDGSLVIGFYNLENLFDAEDDPRINDAAFLPDGENQWTEDKYQMKLHNMASAIKAMAEYNGQYHAILGVAEVENIRALSDLLAQPELKDSGYKGILEEGGDGRGIDVGLIYRPDVFQVQQVKSIPYNFNDSSIDFYMTKQEQRAFSTRDVLRGQKAHGSDPSGLLRGNPVRESRLSHLRYRRRGAGLCGKPRLLGRTGLCGPRHRAQHA